MTGRIPKFKVFLATKQNATRKLDSAAKVQIAMFQLSHRWIFYHPRADPRYNARHESQAPGRRKPSRCPRGRRNDRAALRAATCRSGSGLGAVVGWRPENESVVGQSEIYFSGDRLMLNLIFVRQDDQNPPPVGDTPLLWLHPTKTTSNARIGETTNALERQNTHSRLHHFYQTRPRRHSHKRPLY